MNEEALLARASEERERIFQRYERGRENLVGQIDPWEDPEFEEYHKTDRYETISYTANLHIIFWSNVHLIQLLFYEYQDGYTWNGS